MRGVSAGGCVIICSRSREENEEDMGERRLDEFTGAGVWGSEMVEGEDPSARGAMMTR